ncbi:hypothetical protein [Sphingosinithalassobacter sp. CS137]|uniref:hypothetical protein n=1 Tax=Sphingosinithalassobacter sp. CS137 TaxID=2762748 RepID=UPI00165E10EF|nr:hypothetical protein [Sphingosinithalassobacter sp. CS137]
MNKNSFHSLGVRIFRFGAVSGLGLLLDTIAFLVLHYFGLPPAAANFLSAGLAVTFVFFASVKRIFIYEGHFVFRLLAAYVAYQFLAIAAASAAVGFLATIFPSLLAKLLILPATFAANFAFMSFLTGNMSHNRARS